MRKLKLLNSFFFNSLLLFFVLGTSLSSSNEPIDIWDLKDKNFEKNLDKTDEDYDNIITTKIKKDANEKSISSYNISGSQDVNLIGLYDPQENNLNIDMWLNTDGDQIKSIMKKINSLDLSDDSNEILKITLLTNSYSPSDKISSEDFIFLKQNFLIKYNNLNLIKQFLVKNKNVKNNSKLTKYYLNSYLLNGEEDQACELFDDLDIFESNEYIDKFKIYCLIKSNRVEEAQLFFDLKKENKFEDDFFEKKFYILIGFEENTKKDISEESVLDFHLSNITDADFSYKPNNKTPKFIWKYLSSYNLLEKINDIDLENDQKILDIEKATHDGNYSEEELFDLYKRFKFSFDELISANENYRSIPNHKGRALLYQRLLLSSNVSEKLDFSRKIKSYMKEDEIDNAFYLELSKILKEIDIIDVPPEHTTFYEKNLIKKTDLKKNIKFNNKIIHQSKLLNYFIKNTNKEKISKDTNEIFKKIKPGKKYVFSTKDKMLLDSLNYDGINIQKKYKNLYEKDPNVPTDLQVLINNKNIGMILLRLVEIIGEDKIENLGTETLYFISTVLNEINLDKLRNSFLLKTLPNKI